MMTQPFNINSSIFVNTDPDPQVSDFNSLIIIQPHHQRQVLAADGNSRRTLFVIRKIRY
jgi:hypothetical protein